MSSDSDRAERNMLNFGYNSDDNDSVSSISPPDNESFFNFRYLVERPEWLYEPSDTPFHTYSGWGLPHETSNPTIFEEGVIHTIPVIFIKVNSVPGIILPIFAHSLHAKIVMEYAREHNNNCFGVSYKLNRNEPTYGTIANIYQHFQPRQFSQRLVIKLSHQRYEILSVDEFPGHIDPDPDQPTVALAQIKIVSDVVLTISSNKLCSMKHHVASHCNVCRKKKMLQTQWPTWVYNQFDANQLASRVLAIVKMFYKKVSFSDDPYLLSIEVTRIGIFNHKQIDFLLGLKSTNLRLQHLLQYWNEKVISNTGLSLRAIKSEISTSNRDDAMDIDE